MPGIDHDPPAATDRRDRIPSGFEGGALAARHDQQRYAFSLNLAKLALERLRGRKFRSKEGLTNSFELFRFGPFADFRGYTQEFHGPSRSTRGRPGKYHGHHELKTELPHAEVARGQPLHPGLDQCQRADCRRTLCGGSKGDACAERMTDQVRAVFKQGGDPRTIGLGVIGSARVWAESVPGPVRDDQLPATILAKGC
jgi:hypothetical protein